MKKGLIIAAAIIVIAGIVIARSAKHDAAISASDKPIIKIGAILPITGGLTNLGEFGNKGAILAIEQVNQNPDNKNHYQLIVENTMSDIKQSIPIYRKLTQLDKVSAIVSFDSGVGHILKPLVAADKILHLSSAADDLIGDGKYNFVNNSDLNIGVARLVDYFKAQGYKRVAIAGSDVTATQKVFSLLEPELKRRGLQVVAKELVQAGQHQLRIEAQKIIASNPDVIFLYGFEPHTSVFAREFQRQGSTIPISGLYTISFAQFPEVLEGAVYIDYAPGNEAFQNDFRKRFGHDPNPAAAVMYDSINVIVRTFEGNGSVEKALIGFEGVNGKMIMKDNGLIHADLIFVRMTDGRPVPIKE
jgi:branched-chain amino acid transport system substrate-binding protein